MKTLKTLAAVLLAVLLAVCAAAAGAHGSAHESATHAKPRPFGERKIDEVAFGREGNPKKVTRTIRVEMADTMRFTPAHVSVKRGQTVRFVLHNGGQLLHEMVLGTAAALKEHAALMKKFPDMEHADANMAHVRAGASGEIVWQFTQAGEFQFACLQPGHYEAGMVGTVSVK